MRTTIPDIVAGPVSLEPTNSTQGKFCLCSLPYLCQCLQLTLSLSRLTNLLLQYPPEIHGKSSKRDLQRRQIKVLYATAGNLIKSMEVLYRVHCVSYHAYPGTVQPTVLATWRGRQLCFLTKLAQGPVKKTYYCCCQVSPSPLRGLFLKTSYCVVSSSSMHHVASS